jgi:Bifunctional DNA primase/polymerase, N-terminal
MTGALQEALRLGLPAFPCRADKTPMTPHGFKNASAEPGALKYLWAKYPGPLIGVPTGEASGLFVVDIDNARHDEANDWLERHAPYLPETRQHQTKSGGVHLLFEHRDGLRNTTSKLAKGIDTRGTGGYIIWWPACHSPAAREQFDPVLPLPEWIAAELVPPAPRFESAPFRAFSGGSPSAKVQGILNKVAEKGEGYRNGILFWAASRLRDMIANHELDQAEAAQSLQALHDISMNSGLSAREIARTMNSAMESQ